MNPEVCDRCRLKYSLLNCENCQESFCSECDSYIHSILSKKDHVRKMIYSQSTHDTISKLNLNFDPKESDYNPQISPASIQQNTISQIPSNSNRYSENTYNNLTYDINNMNNNINLSNLDQENLLKQQNNSEIIPEKLVLDSFKNKNNNIEEINQVNNNNEIYENNNNLNKNMSGYYINEIKNIYQYEKNELILKINELSKELVNTKTNLGEHIDYLNNYIIQLDSQYKEMIAELTLKNSDDLKTNTLNKDTRIKELESELSMEKEKNEKLQQKIEEYEETIKSNKFNIEKLSDEKIYLDSAKKTSEERFRQKISEMEETYANEICVMKNNYENELLKLKSELDASKMDYLKMTENSKENMNKIMIEKNNAKAYYDNVIKKLQEEIANKNAENEKLLFMSKNLEQNNEDLNDQLIKMNDEINKKEMDKKAMLKTINKMKKEKNDVARTNLKYHSVIYGRFKKK